MFDVGFFELALIGVIALLVVGPERLPKLARTVGAWIKRMRQFVGSVQQDIEKEIQAEELKKALESAKSLQQNPLGDQLKASLDQTKDQIGLTKVLEDTQQTVADIKQHTAATHKTNSQTNPPNDTQQAKPQ